jgi:hypothetical protein
MPLDDYKSFIDALVQHRPCVNARWVREHRPWPDSPENATINEFVASLTKEHREVLASLLQHARDGGMHDTLVHLNDAVVLDGYRLLRHGRELPQQPFGTTMYYDWVCRAEGDNWPSPIEETG